MQTFQSMHGSPDIAVSDECPTIEIRHKLDRTHVGVSFSDIRESINKAVEGQQRKGVAGWTPSKRLEAVRFAEWYHYENQAEYRHATGATS